MVTIAERVASMERKTEILGTSRAICGG